MLLESVRKDIEYVMGIEYNYTHNPVNRDDTHVQLIGTYIVVFPIGMISEWDCLLLIPRYAITHSLSILTLGASVDRHGSMPAIGDVQILPISSAHDTE